MQGKEEIKLKSKDIYVGIDPGLHGALAAVSGGGEFIGVWDTSVLSVKRGRKNKTVYIPTQMAQTLRNLLVSPKNRVRVVGLEFIHSMPGQGVSSMFSMGQGFGIWEGVTAALGLPTEYVTPQRWKKTMLGVGSGTDKPASIVKALALFPSAEGYLKRKKDDGRAEAILIAEYFRRVAE